MLGQTQAERNHLASERDRLEQKHQCEVLKLQHKIDASPNSWIREYAQPVSGGKKRSLFAKYNAKLLATTMEHLG